MKKVLLSTLAVATVMSFMLAAPSQASTKINTADYAKSRIKSLITIPPDPSGGASLAKLPAHLRAAIAPNYSSGGCPDASQGANGIINVRANQECTNQSAAGYYGRGQSQNETAGAVDPTNPNNILLAQNDYLEGDGACGVDYSTNGGDFFGSRKLPINFTAGFLGGLRHYFTSSGDPSVAFDSSGEAYMMCGAFDRAQPVNEMGVDATTSLGFGPSALVLFRSGDKGFSWEFPGSIVTSTGGPAIPGSTVGLLDKQYMAVDSNPASPWADRIYVVWANYAIDFSKSPIYESYSSDHGVTWSAPKSVSGLNKTLCPIFNAGDPKGTCNESQFADPFIGPDGSLYVAFVNFNNCSGSVGCSGDPNDNHNQILLVKSTDGGNSFSAPVKVSDYYDLPDCVTYTGQNAFRACVPTQGLGPTSIFRATNYPSGTVMQSGRIVVDFGSYINANSNRKLGNCTPAGLEPSTFLNLYTGVGDPGGCNNDILRSASNDGGATFTGSSTKVTALPSLAAENPQADQFWQWTASVGNRAASSYYDRSYDSCQITGCQDITLSSTSAGAPDDSVVGTFVRVTDVSMSPSNEFPAATGYSLFMGDYAGLAVGSDRVAHPVWSDTRNPIYSWDGSGDARVTFPVGFGSDIYTAAVPL